MLGLLVTALVVIAAIAVGVRFLESHLAFFPTRGETAAPADLGSAFAAADIETADRERLHGWILTNPRPRATVLYFHGNGGNLSIWTPILTGVYRQGFTVIAFDYRGYGLSTGRPSERGLYRDADAIIEHAWRDADRSLPMIYWGRSLGTVIAAYAATRRPPDGAILEAGFPNARALIRSSPPMLFLSLFSSYRFPTSDLMRQVQAPVLVVHGDRDTVVPYELGQSLFERIDGPKRFLKVAGGDHNDIAPPDPVSYWKAIDTFIDGLQARSKTGS
jgi:pimeloyl-ACP methyl ester carboxylesterase